jgi:hypothetical protein
MLKATHVIDLGKATLDPKNVILTKDARELLATDKAKFTETYGTHFIAGYIKGCELSVFFKKIAKDKSKVFKFASELKASYQSIDGVSSKTSYESSSSTSDEKTDISI